MEAYLLSRLVIISVAVRVHVVCANIRYVVLISGVLRDITYYCGIKCDKPINQYINITV